MRTTVVPAQITTVEDKIAGNLNITQVLLLMSPVFFGILMYAFIPPFMKIEWFKWVLTFLVAMICVTLALRIKEKLLLDWLIVYARFSLRPAYYIFDKNDSSCREISADIQSQQETSALSTAEITLTSPKPIILTVDQSARYEQIVNSDKYSLQFQPVKKGGVRVVIEEIGT